MIKQLLKPLAIALSIFLPSITYGGGMAVYDPLNWIQNQFTATEARLQTALSRTGNDNALLMIKNQIQRLDELRVQTEKMQSQYDALSGRTSFGAYLSGPFQALDRNYRPKTWQETVYWSETIGDEGPRNDLQERARAYEEKNRYVSAGSHTPFINESMTRNELNNRKSSSIALGLKGQEMYERSGIHHANIVDLQGKLDRSETTKQTADLNAALLTELGKMSAAQLQIASIRAEMDALDRKQRYNEDMRGRKFMQYKVTDLMNGG